MYSDKHHLSLFCAGGGGLRVKSDESVVRELRYSEKGEQSEEQIEENGWNISCN